MIERGLRSEGCRTTVVGDGLAALEAVTEGDVDLVVLDVGLPRMDGFTVLRMLRTMKDPVPIIMCRTTTGTTTDRSAGHGARSTVSTCVNTSLSLGLVALTVSR